MNKIIEDYVLLQKVGQGQYGNVYKAENRKNKGVYAVKVMNVQKFKHTPKLSELTNNQIAILSKINNPNIIKFIEMLRTANNYYLVYEFCNGGTLADLIKSKTRLSQQEVILIFSQLRNAFEALYAQNILHRDLKPTNILFHNGVIKLADFGFCKELMKAQDMTHTMVGSPLYMAPEVLKGLIYDIRADIWSLGVVLYEMVYGICPFEQSTIQKLVSMIDNSTVRFPSDVQVSQNLKTLMRRMLTIKYRDRITPQQLLKYPLQPGKQEKKETVSVSAFSFKEVAKFVRRSIQYLSESLDLLTDYVDDLNYLKLIYLVYKILQETLTYTNQQSHYWQILKVNITEERWENMYTSEAIVIKQFGSIAKEALTSADNDFDTKIVASTEMAQPKCFMKALGCVTDMPLKDRMLNCLLINRHFRLVMEKKTPDFIDYQNSKKSIEEKEQLCQRYAKST